MISNYTDLKDTVGRWLARETETVFTDEVPTFIQLAEAQMYNDLRAREMICRAQALMNEEFEWLPDSFIEMQEVSLIKTDNKGKQSFFPLIFLEVDALLKARENTSAGDPTWYAVYGEQFRFVPPPSGEEDPPLNYEVVYWGKFAPLSADVPTNAILTAYPQIYLYGALLQAEAFIMNDQRLAIWQNVYTRAVEEANKVAEARRGTSAVGAPY